MSNSISSTMQTSKMEFLEWFMKVQDENIINEFIESMTKKKAEETLKPMTDEEYYQKVKKAIDSAENGRVISTAELRERAKTWGR